MANKQPATESFSDQLRKAVRESGTTSYALAKQLGVSESTLSRFLSGERGLTLNFVDKLADVLGLQVLVTVQKAIRPARRGPKPKKEKSMTLAKAIEWHLTAQACAMDAYTRYFSSRRGIWLLEEVDKLCVYNNNPYAKFPDLRDQETAEFRNWLKANGIRELGYATYPPKDEESAGYTYALVLDAGSERQSEIMQELQRILRESWKRMEAHS